MAVGRVQAQLHVTMTFSPVSQDPGWGNGLGTGPDMGSLPQTYFQMRHGCRMHLYNDAYQVRGLRPGCSAWHLGPDLQPMEAYFWARGGASLVRLGLVGQLRPRAVVLRCCPEGQGRMLSEPCPDVPEAV